MTETLRRTTWQAEIELVIPSETRYLSAARVVAATLAADAGFDLDDLDRVRVGTNELLTILIEAVGPEQRISMSLASDRTDDGVSRLRIAADAVGVDAARPINVELDALASRILNAVADEYGVTPSGFHITVSAS